MSIEILGLRNPVADKELKEGDSKVWQDLIIYKLSLYVLLIYTLVKIYTQQDLIISCQTKDKGFK